MGRNISKNQRKQQADPGCAAASRIRGAGRTVRAPGRSQKPRSRQLADPGCAAASRSLDVGRTVRAPGGSHGAPGAGSSPALGALQTFRILDTGRTVRAPSGSQGPRSRQLAGPGCAAAFRIRGAGCSIRAPGSPPDPRHRQHGQTSREDLRSSGAGSSPTLGALQTLPDSRRRPHGQSTRRIPEAKERAARPPGCAAGPPGSAAPAARSEHPADPRAPGADSSPALDALQTFRILDTGRTVRSTRRIPGPQEQAARPPGCAAVFRICGAGHVGRGVRETSGSSTVRTGTHHKRALNLIF